MRTLRRISEQSGQALLIAILIFVTLLLAVPAIIYVNQMATRHHGSAQWKKKGYAVAQSAISYGIQQLSRTAPIQWPYSTGGTLPTPGIFPSAQDLSFQISYSSSNAIVPADLEAYQVKILSTPLDERNKPISGSTLGTVVSQKTAAVVLPNGYGASTALMMMEPPVASSGLVVHAGPAAVFSNTTWTMPGLNMMDAMLFPRKFSQGRMTGNLYNRTTNDDPQRTDKKEYWANTNLGFPNVVNTAEYITRAKRTVMHIHPKSRDNPITVLNPTDCDAAVPDCAYYIVADPDAALFSSTFEHYGSTDVFYIQGHAEFRDVNMDFKHDLNSTASGAIIVTGNLTLANPGASGLELQLRIPPTAPLEYPYTGTGSPPSWPCQNNWNPTGGTCCSDETGLGISDTNGLGTGGGFGLVQFRGFLYVQGNLMVTNPGWFIAGTVRVDGTINAPPYFGTKTALSIYYDDEINHNILVTPMELMIDDVREHGN